MRMSVNKRRPYSYAKLVKEDPEEASHRRAQFLIYRALEKADRHHSGIKRPCFARMKICKLKIKISDRFCIGRMNKGFLSTVSAARLGIRTLKRFVFGTPQMELVAQIPRIDVLS